MRKPVRTTESGVGLDGLGGPTHAARKGFTVAMIMVSGLCAAGFIRWHPRLLLD